MAEPQATASEPATRYRDLLRGVTGGTVAAVVAIAAWGTVPSTTIRSGDVAADSVPIGPAPFIWPLAFAVIGLVVGVLAGITFAKPRGGRSMDRWIALALLAPAVVVGFFIERSVTGFGGPALYIRGEEWLWLDIPAASARLVVAWLSATGVVYVLGHAIARLILSTRATRLAGMGEDPAR